mmetsp:Transcript_6939/g.9056  ORF Transcript_6939/g.9056 Transcript_6939/m.9056 type:complete len:309 (+) Transcript_6939:319-1245(+)
MGDGVDLSEGKEGNFIVGVVGGTTESKEHGKRLVGVVTSSDKTLEGLEESSSFHGKHHRDEEKSGHGGKHSVKVLGIKVLSNLLSGHGLLGKNTTGSRGNVGKHGRSKSKHCKGKFLHGSDGNSTDDGEESHVNLDGKDLSEEKSVESASDNGFRGLDNVGKGDGSSTKGNDGTNMDTGVAKSNGKKGLKLRSIELGGLTGTSEPHRNEVKDTGGHLDGGNGPGEVKDIQGLLVVDIVSDVEKVPESKVHSNGKSFLETSRGRFFSSNFLGSSGSRKSKTSGGLHSGSLGGNRHLTCTILQRCNLLNR